MATKLRARVKAAPKPTAPPPELDRTDKAILRALQKDASISNVALAKRVNLSPAACLRRVERLKAAAERLEAAADALAADEPAVADRL